jgi:type III secretory pathway component EscT
LIDNKFSLPTGVISTIVPNVGVGSLISVLPSELVFSPIRNGVYNSITCRLLNKDTLQPQKIEDNQIVIILGIRKKYSYELPPDRY